MGGRDIISVKMPCTVKPLNQFWAARKDVTNGRTEYNDSVKNAVTRDLVTTRIDHDFTERDRLFVTYNGSFPDGTSSLVGSPWRSLGTLVTAIVSTVPVA